jgi:hypothetical protein
MNFEIDDAGVILGARQEPTSLRTETEIKPLYIVFYKSLGLDTYLGFKPCQKTSVHLEVNHGRLYQYCPLTRKAWHAGQSYWQGHNGINSFGIGIAIGEIEEENLQLLDCLIPTIVEAYNIRDIVGHSDITQGRYNDPGSAFPMERYKPYVQYGNAESGGRYTVAVPLGETLNVRGGPGVLFEVIDKLEPGDTVKVLRQSEDRVWLSVSYETARGRRTGWCHESCLRRS